MSTIFEGWKIPQYVLPDYPLAEGGEGKIYASGTKIIKIYNPKVLANSPQLERKIRYMIEHPPMKTLRWMAWPIDIVKRSGKFQGFVMNNLSGFSQLKDLYSYNLSTHRSQELKLKVARNLAALVREIHNAGYIIGDFNPKNIGYNSNGNVCIYDNDSFQFRDDDGTLYKCEVNFEGYVAPEVMEETEKVKREFIMKGKTNPVTMKDLSTGFTPETDNFALAVHIFQLLMNGMMPYSSVDEASKMQSDSVSHTNISSSTAPPSTDENVKHDHFCFNPGRVPLHTAVPSKEAFPKPLIKAFSNSFRHVGIFAHRTTPQAWVVEIESYCGDLCRCKTVPEHIYWNQYRTRYGRCPYCEADQRTRANNEKLKNSVSVQKTNPFGFTNNNTTQNPVQKTNPFGVRNNAAVPKPVQNPTPIKTPTPVQKPSSPQSRSGYRLIMNGYGRLDLMKTLQANHIEYVDKRDKRGCLWIISKGYTTDLFISDLAKYGYKFSYSDGKSRSAGYRPAYFTKQY